MNPVNKSKRLVVAVVVMVMIPLLVLPRKAVMTPKRRGRVMINDDEARTISRDAKSSLPFFLPDFDMENEHEDVDLNTYLPL